ncbi:MAG: DUF4465 domain-containing protein [Flavobacteriales bacterium]|nr:DUF4465 domain-containing protein [Flavobacteriales bacterium]
MRKIYKTASLACLGLVLASQNTNAQSVSDFESLTLGVESAWDGSDLSGSYTPINFTTNFMSGDAVFNNAWDTTYGGPGYWYAGFTQSTFTDSVTSGAGNINSSRAGSGNNGSLTYLVAKNNTKITLQNNASDSIVNGIFITNGTYAANSMRDGDGFAKQFGGATGNDQDWFLLTIKGTDSLGIETTDSINFYLADYRFTNNTQDYIVKDWQYVDLTSLGNVVNLTFSLTSSDVGGFGMNTPAYFCIDDITSSTANLIDFEDLGFTTADSVWNGSDFSGTPNTYDYFSTFSDGDASFGNVWDSQWSYWKGGFSYSNMTDSTTSGSGNIYSARAGSGYNSDNYLIAKNNTKIYLTGAAANNTVSGVYITNTTYAANSMRDGDAFGKQFGGATGNDQDWYLLTIKGYTGGSATTDSVNFYLADYRFANNTLDYIVKDWQWVDLTSLGTIDSISFTLRSSDTAPWGINTPTFFAIDNFNDQTITVNELSEEISLSSYPNPTKGNITIDLENNVNTLQIIDVSGKTVRSENNLKPGTHQLSLTDLNSGIYFVKIISDNRINVQKFIKQ